MQLSSRFHSFNWLWPLLVVASILRVWHIAAPPLWYDEKLMLWMVRGDYATLLTATGADVHPPLYLSIAWVMVHLFGESAFALRLPSVVFSVAALPVAYALGNRLQLPRPAIYLGLVFLTLAPFQINYAQEARMYALLQLIVLLQIAAALNGRVWVFALFAILGIYTHNYGWIYGAVIGILLFVQVFRRDGWSAIGQCLSAACVVVVSYVPWASMLASQLGEQATEWWKLPTTLGEVIYIAHVLWWWRVPDVVASAGVVMVFSALTLGVVYARECPRVWVLVYLALAPTVVLLVVEFLYRPVLLHRALIGSAVPLYLLAAYGLYKLSPALRGVSVGVFGAWLVLGVFAFYPTRLAVNGGHAANDAVQRAIAQRWHGEPMVHGNVGTLVDVELPGAAYLLPEVPGSSGIPNSTIMQAVGATIAPLDAVLDQHGAAFVVWAAGPNITPNEDRAIANAVSAYESELIFEQTDGLSVAKVWRVWQP